MSVLGKDGHTWGCRVGSGWAVVGRQMRCAVGPLTPRPGVSNSCGAAGRVGMLEVSRRPSSATISGCLVQKRRG